MAFINTILPFNTNINVSPVHFRASSAYFPSGAAGGIKDSYVTNPLQERFSSAAEIEARARANPVIVSLLNRYNIPLKVNQNVLDELNNGHLKTSRVIAAQIYSSLPQDLKSEVNMSDIQQAAMLHDIGKVFIPDKILNKKGKLTDEEKKIMEIHSQLGYELLKDTGLNNNVLQMVKYHHQTPQGDGYPKADSDFNYTVGLDILRAADEYDALREKRSYKPSMSKEESLSIVAGEVAEGHISPQVYEALVKIV